MGSPKSPFFPPPSHKKRIFSPKNTNKKSSIFGQATSAAASSSSSGEIHVIVGPMFAGKTSTLLRRIKTESSNGSFQADAREIALQLDKSLKDLCFSGRVVEAVQMLCHAGVQ
ncbi:unnamed protein product, partial [Coffea canephora]